MKRLAVPLCAGLLVLGLVPGAALAAPAIDQHSDDISYDWGGTGTPTYAQTFTAGTTGTLTSVDLYLDAVSVATTVDVSIEALDGSGYPDGTVLASGSASVPVAAAGWISVSLSAYSVTSGHVYAIVFSLAGQSGGTWDVLGSIGNPYAKGEALDASSGWHGLQDVTTSDFAFETYVDAKSGTSCATPTPTPIPTPTLAPPALINGGDAQPAQPAPTLCTTPPPTGTASGGSSNDSTPLAAVLICLAFAGLGLAAVETQRWRIRG